MEAGVIIKMVEYELCHCCVVIDVIVSEDYRTIRDVLKIHQELPKVNF